MVHKQKISFAAYATEPGVITVINLILLGRSYQHLSQLKKLQRLFPQVEHVFQQ